MDAIVNLSGYEITEQLYAGTRTLVYRVIRSSDRQPVVIKILRNEYPNFNELIGFRNQYTIAKNLDFPSIIKPLTLEVYRNSYALVMEDFGGVSLSTYLKTVTDRNQPSNSLSLIEFLNISLQVTDILEYLYQNRVIHKDIKPANILINPETKQVKLIDFSIASLLPRETQEILNPNVLEGTLAYISPEQTGRMNRGIDYRSDFYSLGVTFYELLIGKLPFVSDEPMELVHCHLAKQPIFVHTIEPNIPLILSQIVGKLMAKNAEDRYQSALGLKHDLETCLVQLQETGKIQDFQLRKRDVTDRFIIPEKLYGRETEVKALLEAFDRVATPLSSPLSKGGQRGVELMLVAGFSGIGKTAVVNEVHKPIVRQRGYFIKGKFDQFNRNIPFSAFVQAFRDLMGQLLSESDAQLQTWKSQILAALGDSGQVIIDVIPELERIIGKQPPVPELSGTAAQNRFNLLFPKFMQVFATPKHPLVMFLDDLQWADSASLNLMQLLIGESQTGYLLAIGAYRDNEVSAAHPLMLTLDAIAKTGATVNTITLKPLSRSSLNQLVSDTLNCPLPLAQPLTELVHQKTQGNPFFATQFLKALHQDELITFDRQAGHWQCDLVRVREAALTSDVVEFMATQLQKLPVQTQEILKLAACVGNQFDLNTLAIVSEQTEVDAAAALWKALQAGLILPQSEVYKFYFDRETKDEFQSSQTVSYKFLHDRVQQAAYSLIAEDRKQATHLSMGQLLLSNSSNNDREERLFEIVNHLNVGIALITPPQERENLAKLNLAAGRKAKTATAYAAAIDYLATGIRLLPADAWENHYPLTLALHEEIAEASYLNTDFEQMEQWASVVLQQAKTLLDTTKVQQTRIVGVKAQGQLLESIQIGLQVLSSLGIEFPEQPTQEDIGQAFGMTRSLWIDKAPGSLLDLPTMRDPRLLAAMEILTALVVAAYVAAPNLMPLLIFKQVELSIQSGNCPISVFAYGDYGLILCGIIGDLENGYEFGELALSLRDRFQLASLKCRNWYVVHVFIKHWKISLSEIVPALQEAYRSGIETGDIETACLSTTSYSYYAYHAGQELAELAQTMDAYRQTIHQYKHAASRHYQEIYQQTVLNLLGQAEVPYCLTGAIFNQELCFPQLQAANQRCALFMWYMNQAILYYLFGQKREAAQTSVQTAQYLDGGVGLFMVPLYSFFDALIQLTQYGTASPEERQAILQQVQQHLEKLQHWAAFAPTNHQHRCELVAAEQYRILGNKTDAIEAYDRAITSAKTNNFIQDEALANELAAKFYLEWGKEKVAAGYMQEAYYCYARWGAKAKTDDLEKRYPQLLQPILLKANQPLSILETLTSAITSTHSIHSSTHKTSTSKSLNHTLDFAALLKVSQTLSSTIELDELLQILTQTMLENSGANKCALMLPQEGEWQVRVMADLEQITLQNVPLENNANLPVKLIQYVKNTLTAIAIDNLEIDLPVIDDYLHQYLPKSVLCLPILNQGNLVGILYLENWRTSGVFTGDRMLILNFLCTQAAISLENARLYCQAQQMLEDLQQAQLQLVQSEKMSALGNLVAGVAHEINNPIGCIVGNVGAAQDYINDLLSIIDLYQAELPQPSAEIEDELEAIDLDYVREDLPKLIRAMKDGGDRITSISKSLRTFSRADSDTKQKFNLHDGIDSTVLILRHRLKANDNRPAIEVVTDYGDIPEIACFPGQLNQVFMNILANAIDALDESNSGRSFAEIEANPNRITIRTSAENERVTIAIADNGSGIPEDIKARIFDHLFTTKAVGKGTGLGLAIARQIIVEKHGGAIAVNSVLGQGTDFKISLPIQ